jgi:hypothetical protein
MIKLTWEEFVQAAIERISESYPICSMPAFMQENGYEPDSEAYTFPPKYVEFEVKSRREEG